jgi:excisionase family DNA binding protein
VSAPRRPLRATLAPSTVRLLVMYLEAQGDDFAAWLSGARRTLTDEDAVALDEDLAVLGHVAGWQRAWLASDVGRSDLPPWDAPPRSAHEITTREAAGMLGLTDRTVRRMLERGELAGRQLNPRSWAVSRTSVELHAERRAS